MRVSRAAGCGMDDRSRRCGSGGPESLRSAGRRMWGKAGPAASSARPDHRQRRARECRSGSSTDRPWADRICQRSTVRTGKPMVGGVRGSHIVLPRFPGAPTAALYTEASDGRPVFVLPWNEQMMVGTTEVADTGDPGKTLRLRAKRSNICFAWFPSYFPRQRFPRTTSSTLSRACGRCPMRLGTNHPAVTRRHFLHDHTDEGAARTDLGHWRKADNGGIAGAGVRPQNRTCGRRAEVDRQSGPGSSLDPMLDQEVIEIARAGSVSEETARGMMEWHGKRAMDIARMALVSAELRAPICPAHLAYRGGSRRSLPQGICRHPRRRASAPRSGRAGRMLVGVVQPRSGIAHWRRPRMERAAISEKTWNRSRWNAPRSCSGPPPAPWPSKPPPTKFPILFSDILYLFRVGHRSV